MGGIRKKSVNKKAGIFAEKPGFKYVIWSIGPEVVGRVADAGSLMAPFCIFLSIKRQRRKDALFDRFSSARTALYTVPVQFRDMFRGKVG
ncbi:hypothetical protein ABH853_21425 [Pseudomonas sp. 13.2]|uniref:Uncharacterized protein n=1 Tax=Pseudomonas sp. 13.2 TaxID=3144665 RepID=A0AAU7BEK0_9PSED